MGSSTGPIESLFAELLEGIEDDPSFDVQGFLAAHAAHAALLEERLEKLRRAGLIVGGQRAGSLVETMRERFGVHGDASALAARLMNEGNDGSEGAQGRAPVEELLPSRVVGGRYRIEAEIGRGGMGRVFRALDLDLGREVALKVTELGSRPPRSDDARRAWLERFLSEARTTAQLEHPSIVPLHDIGFDRSGELYYTMKLVEGRTLEERIREWHDGRESGSPFPLQELLRIVLQIGDAVAFAHDRGVVHRDLKPSNVMTGRFGEVQVMDWGLSKLLEGAPAPEAAATSSPESPARRASPSTPVETRTGEVLGTPSHMAPEQARGDPRAVDRRADVYGLGAILFHGLWGCPPNRTSDTGVSPGGGTAKDVAPPWPVPRELRAVCARALQHDVSQRTTSVTALTDDLRAFLEARPGEAWRDGPVRALAKVVRRHPKASIVVFSTVLLLLVGALAVVVLRDSRRRAKLEQDRADLAEDRLEAERELATAARLNQRLLERGTELAAKQLGAGTEQVPAVLEAELAEFRELGFALDGPEPVEELVSRITRLRRVDHVLAASVAAAIESMADIAVRAQVPVALRFLEGTLDRPITRKRALWESWSAEHPDVLRFMPRLDQLVDLLVEEPWRREVWAAYRGRYGDPMIPWPTSILELEPETAADLSFLGMKLAGDPDSRVKRRAAELLERSLELEPENFWAHQVLGVWLAEGDVTDFDRALGHLESAVTQNPRAFRAWSNLGGTLLLLNRDDLALRALERAAFLDPEDPLAQMNLGAALQRLGMMERALSALDQAVALDPSSSKGLYNRSLVHSALGHPEAAETDVRGALSLDERYVNAWIHLGALLAQGGREDEAAQAFDKALELDPRNTDAAERLGQLYSASEEGQGR